jgi:hypothetical protein
MVQVHRNKVKGMEAQFLHSKGSEKTMTNLDQLTLYRDLLVIRQSARRREVTMIGAIFLVSFTFLVAKGILSGLGGREMYIVAAMNVVFMIVFLMAWVRLEIINGVIDLIDNLPIGER